MRTVLGLVLATLVGIGGGIFLARYQSRSVELPIATAPTSARLPGPCVDIDPTDFNFGQQDLAAKGVHEFIIRNKGGAALVLSQGDTSCKCTVSKIAEPRVEPGEQTSVRVEWHAEQQAGPFKQTATIITNDPGRPRVVLTVRGEITAAVRAKPTEVVLNDVSASEGPESVVRVFGYGDKPLEVTRVGLTQAEDADSLRLSVRPLTNEELREQPDARSGQAVVVAVKPGLPRPAIKQTIRIETNSPEVPTVEVPVSVTFASDMMVVGRGWDSTLEFLDIGPVNRRQGTTQTVRIVVRGQQRDQVRFKVRQLVPEFVRVTIGEPVAINDGVVYHTPITIEIPPDSRPCNYLGIGPEEMGQVVLQSTHPTHRELRLGLRFVVENSD